MTLRLRDELTEALRRQAGREGRSPEEVARSALEEHFGEPTTTSAQATSPIK